MINNYDLRSSVLRDGFIETYRCERKFSISAHTLHQVELSVKTNPAIFKKAYPSRYVNNLYLDSTDKTIYLDSLNGVNKRLKVRIRWYGNFGGDIENPVLELKIKKGVLGGKVSYPLKKFSIDDNLSMKNIYESINTSDIPESLRLNLISLEAALVNRYLRKYFESADRNFRVTIDNKMQAYPPSLARSLHNKNEIEPCNTILELKYSHEHDANAQAITKYFPYRLSQFSKYVTGMQQIGCVGIFG